ncbi:polymeric immunoglobulin receptor-like [Colossoma macropomum]|uniref:polymeric immunoglobulin receptor-like n=1 Tax=Colossoma macropomum TaxID=42526 RepID=UPI0018655FB7|nr:polymeric immunoglobulin receptor-like [Colossoma macropomum]
MLLTFYLLFIGLHVSEGCTLVNNEQILSITAYKGGSVLLPCYCNDLHTTPEEFSWKKDNTNRKAWEVIYSESGQYRNRVQLLNGHSPGNLSLLISHLTEEDGGDYRCSVKDSHIIFRLSFKACTLEKKKKKLNITAYRGGSVLLPCYCTDLHAKPEEFTWQKYIRNSWEEISSESGQYRNRVQLVNGHSPGNLSLLISHLTEEDEGGYWCGVKDSYITILLTVKEGPPTTTTSTAAVNVQTSPTTSTTHSSQKPEVKHKGPPKTTTSTAVDIQTIVHASIASFSKTPDDYSIYFFILIPVLLLLLGLGVVIYWRYRGQRRGQTESREKRMMREQKTPDEVMYSTIVHSKTTRTTTVTDIGEKTEYATIRVK